VRILSTPPVHSSWLNQVEIYLSIVQRKVLTPNDFADLAAVEQRLLAFQCRYEQAAKPFQWRFTRADPRGPGDRRTPGILARGGRETRSGCQGVSTSMVTGTPLVMTS
jgi:hypothetical protein